MSLSEYQQVARTVIQLCNLSGLVWYIKLSDGRYWKIIDIREDGIDYA